MPPRVTRPLSFVLAQVGWLAVATLAAADRPAAAALAAAPVILLNVILAPDREAAALLVAVAALLGPALDRVLVALGLLHLRQDPLWMPAWWCALWAMFASSVPAGLSFLHRRPRLAAAIGAVFAPLSYAAGARLGAIGLGEPRAASFAAIAAEWGVALPLLVAASVRLDRPRSAAARPEDIRLENARRGAGARSDGVAIDRARFHGARREGSSGARPGADDGGAGSAGWTPDHAGQSAPENRS